MDSQEPITLPDSEPEPDVVIVRGDTRQYLDRHPGPGDVALIIEVSDTTLERDRPTKQRAYARSGIPVYWIVNLNETQVEVYTHPSDEGYRQRQDYGVADSVMVAIEEKPIGEVAITALLP